MILALDKDGKEITIEQVRAWLLDGQKKDLANFLYDRLYGRYIKPFDYPSRDYKKKYKNGFSIMTNCCLLIETFVSWTEPVFKKTDRKSERCFGYFFVTQKRFASFSKNGLSKEAYLDLDNKEFKGTGIPNDFYKNVRCGLLHNGETKNKWKILREGKLYDETSKEINSVKFMNELREVIKEFKDELMNSDFNKGMKWKTFKDRLSDLLENS